VTSPAENKALAVAWFESGFGDDFEQWASLLHDDFRYWHGATWQDRAGYLAVAERLAGLVQGEFTMALGSVIAEGDTVVIECESGMTLNNGDHYSNFYVNFLTFRDGKILRLKGHNDTLHAFRTFGNPGVSAEGVARQSPLEEVTATLRGTPPQPARPN
jgi:ketosteroid isomerase-like protein